MSGTKGSSPLERLRALDHEIQLIRHSVALLHWDQETGMPGRGIGERSEQLGLLEGLAHEKLSSDEMGEQLEAAGSTSESPAGGEELESQDRAFLRALRREYDRATKIPNRLVTELAQEVSTAQSVWVDARSRSDFGAFSPHLEKLLALNIEKAQAVGYEDHPYDALLDEYEPWMTTKKVGSVFSDLKEALVPLVQELKEKNDVDSSFLSRHYPIEQQEALSRRILEDMGYDFERGRLDVTAHPFTTAVGGDDVRITTRYHEYGPMSAFFGTVHEAGHALYEMGIADEFKCSVLGEGTSLGVHESQSRTWENMIARSIQFWRKYFPVFREYFPSQLKGVTLSRFLRAVNRVQPSLIRIEADEVTYSLHVILRYELEQAMVSGDLKVSDLPGEWNRAMEQLLGIRPENDAEGVLQDIHWAMGAIGYFPTYALGNLYGAQFYEAMRRDLANFDGLVAHGEFSPIREWMRDHIHRHGAAKTPSELLWDVCRAELDAQPFVDYLRDKYTQLLDM